MSAARCLRQSLLTLCILLVAATGLAHAQTAAGQFQPKVGQPGKDVVWVPTPQILVDRMLDMANVTPEDFVMDLGSGDGRTVITAAKRGVRAMGVEYNPDMVELSRRAAADQGVTDKATFVQADLFKTDLSKATVITMFLLPTINLQLRPTILNLTPGTRIVSNTFTMEEWQPDEWVTLPSPGCTTWCDALLWIVPEKAQGIWQTPQGALSIGQSFQMLSGTLGSIPITGRMNGTELSFTAGGVQYRGRVNGNSILGTTGPNKDAWSATRSN